MINSIREKPNMKQPQIHKNSFIAAGAVVLGDVTVSEDCSIWYNATVRAGRESITIGIGSNIQDNAVVHVDTGYPVMIGEYVTIGHGAVIHGCSIGSNSLIGMGAILLNGAQIGKNCIIGAGALVTQNMVIQDNSMVIGSPAKVIRRVTPDEAASNRRNAGLYIKESKEE